MNKETVDDIVVFYKTIGALDEISERQLVCSEDLNTFEHFEYLEELCKKYNLDYSLTNDLIDDILEIECIIDEKFRSILLNC